LLDTLFVLLQLKPSPFRAGRRSETCLKELGFLAAHVVFFPRGISMRTTRARESPRKPSRNGKEKIGGAEQLEQAVKRVLKQYLEGRFDIAQVAEKIVDLLYPWETHYAPLLAYRIDPWARRADDILAVTEIITTCENAVLGESPDRRDEEFVQCVLVYMRQR
jgi:hypothetical protein